MTGEHISRWGDGEPVLVTGVPAWRCERCGALWVQRVGLSLREAAELLAATTSHGNIPEPLRLAHIIAGGVERGASRGRP